MFKEQFLDHSLSAMLKKKGFTEPCMGFYEIALESREDEHDGFSGPFGWEKGEVSFTQHYFENGGIGDVSNEYWLLCGAPLWQQAINWILKKFEEQGLESMRFTIFTDGSGHFTTSEQKLINDIDFDNITDGILKALELI